MLLVFRRQHDHVLSQAGYFVNLFFNGDARLQILELNGAAHFGENRESVGVPFRQLLAHLRGLAFFNQQARAVGHFVAFLFTSLFVHHGHVAAAVHYDGGAPAAADVFDVNELRKAGAARFQFRLLGNTADRASDVESTHGELSAWFADGLRSDDADGFAQFHHAPAGQVAAVTARADPAAGFASEHRADFHPHDAGGLDGIGQLFTDFLVDLNDYAALEVLDPVERNAAHDAVAQRLDFFLALFEDRLHIDAVGSAAVHLGDDDVLRHVHQAASEVAGIGGLQSGIRQTLASAVRGDKVLQHVEAFAEVGSNGRLNHFAGRLGHQTAHPGKLADLLLRAAGARIGHDVNRINDAFLILPLKSLEELVGDSLGNLAPNVDHLVVAFAVGDRAVVILLLHLDNFLLGVFNELVLVSGNEHVINADGDAGLGGIEEAKFLQLIEHENGSLNSVAQVAVVNQLLHALLLKQAVYERSALGQVVVENRAAHGGVQELLFELDGLGVHHVLIVIGGGEVNHLAREAQAHWRQDFHFAGFQRQDDFFNRAERAAFALPAGLGLGEVVDAENHVLRRNDQWHTARRRQHIARAEHQHGSLNLRLRRKWNVHGHLVAVKVGVERRADQRMDADRLAFDQYRLECLNTQTVKCGSAVQ